MRWSEAALLDLVRIFEFNAGFSEERAITVERHLLAGASQIARLPLLGRPIGGAGIRERSLTDIQYVIRYLPEDEARITVLSIRHTRENRESA